MISLIKEVFNVIPYDLFVIKGSGRQASYITKTCRISLLLTLTLLVSM